VVLPRSLGASNRLYAGGADLSHRYLSPLFGSHEGFPPTFLQSGTRDLFLSNAVRMHRSLRRSNIAAELHVFEAMPHGGFGGATPEDAELNDEVVRFVAGCWRAHCVPTP
jgi:acetyl esterase/lipase